MGFYTNYDCDEDRRTARILLVLLSATLAIYGMTVFAGVYWHDTRLIIATLAAGAVLAIALGLLRLGHPRECSLLFILSVLSLVTAVCTFGQGVHDPTVMVYPVVVLFLGLMLPGLAFRIGVALTLASMGWLVFGEESGLFLPQPSQRPNWIYFMILGAILLVGALAVDLLAANLRRNVRVAQQELAHRKRVEEALRESEDRYRGIVEQSVIGIGVSKGNHVRFANEALLRIFGYEDLEDLKRVPLMDLVAPSSRELVADRMRMAAEGRSLPQEFEYDVVCKGGQIKTLLASSARLSREGEVYTQTAFQDITERKRAEELLKDEISRRRMLVEQSTDGIVVLDQWGKVYEANQQYARMLGYSMEEVNELHVWDWDTQFTKEQLLAMLEAVDSSGDHFETHHRRKDGTLCDVEISTNGAVYSGKKFIFCVCRDITERKRAEAALRDRDEQLRQSQKMEAVGQLAGGVAHDFNNLLTAILGYSDLLLASKDLTDSPALADVGEIKAAAERASALTGQILAFSRRQALRPTVVSLNDVLSGMEPLLRRTLGEDIDLVSRRDPCLGRVEADLHQFEQVLMNLAVNARDAMVAGGRLTVETANVELDEQYCRIHPEATPGGYVMLAVSDTGVGMDEATRERVFEPFFTTKAPGEGTGLGLATVYGIVRQSNGSISVYSEPGQGTSFKIYLPRATMAVPKEVSVSAETTLTRGEEIILVVEDEVALRKLVARVLRERGYRVLEAGSGAEALRVVKEAGCGFDLLLTDMILPGGMQGNELARDLLTTMPGLPVLYVSGYTRNAIVHAGRLDDGVNFLEKPFTPEALATTVRVVLDRVRVIS